MDHLGLTFEKFDTESKTQLFIDKESVAAVTDQEKLSLSGESHRSIHGSVASNLSA